MLCYRIMNEKNILKFIFSKLDPHATIFSHWQSADNVDEWTSLNTKIYASVPFDFSKFKGSAF